MDEFEEVREDSVTVGTSSVLVSEARPPNRKRQEINFTNASTGGQILYYAYGIPAVAGKGGTIYPGGSLQGASGEGFKLTNSRIFFISSAAGGTLTVHER